MTFQKANNITGWVVFAIALITYWLTFEETASYWDCGEFIAVSYKLEVSHPPGAPLFMLVARVFSFLAMGDKTMVAYWINVLSVVGGAFTILFLFWSITLLGRKMYGYNKLSEVNEDKTLVLMGAGVVGALAYTFSDSFWFSAVEAEVYSMSAFFTALVVWMVLKWDVIENEDEAKANRWLILLAYMIGLSIGFHLLNLLSLPALGLIYYFKKYKPSTWGIIAALALSGGLVLFINDFIIPGLPTIAGGFEVFFVNNIGLPFGSGALVFCLLLIAGLYFAIRFSQKNNRPLLNTFVLATTFILIGYCSYATIIIRANFDPPINENAPKDVMSFVRYLKREQYGSRPLIYGPYFNAQVVGYEQGAPVYTKGKDKYEITDHKAEYEYDQSAFLPRLWSSEHAQTYQNMVGLGEGETPTFMDNMKYMFQHQIGTMYVRYFFWNFAGRESDEQGARWLNPFDWFDDEIPAAIAENRGRNNYFMIPFILGLIGMFHQIVKDTKNFAVVALLFLLLGVAIVVYLNSPPVEPRERDYIYAGSTYAFTFWIGLSVIALADLFAIFLKKARPSAVIATVVGLLAPGIMLAEGWDDHDRSDRFFSVDSAKNYLESCAPNAILFTGGDNDTFPLWYAQEVEGIRTDVRVVVLSYYNTDWYIAQSMRKQYESEPFPYTLSLKQYQQGGPNYYLRVRPNDRIKVLDVKQFIDALSKDFEGLRGEEGNILPARQLALAVDTAHVQSLGFISKEQKPYITPMMTWKVTRGLIEKKDLAIMDVMATNNWERPIYFNPTSLAQIYIDLSQYAIMEGMTSRLIPAKNPNPQKDYVNTSVAYDNMLNKFGYRGLDNPKAYYNEDYRGFVQNHRSSLNSLAEALLDEYEVESGNAAEVISKEGVVEDKREKAKKVIYFSLDKMPDVAVPYDLTMTTTVQLLMRLGDKEKALEIANTIGTRADEMLTYLIRKDAGISLELRKNMFIIADLQRVMLENGETELAKKYEDMYQKHMTNLEPGAR
ncbi:MAG TPA: DUF2723 domain-containing protein [Cyclobacteriaceae bacterium]|nr:DUF2723 domain-containing protein [Cyclobacteriaceae bacterium]